MSSPPPKGSTATYIIICSGRTGVAAASGLPKKIAIVSDCAARLVSYVCLANPGKVKPIDTKEISDLQHQLMDYLLMSNPMNVKDEIARMFTLLYALEDKFPA